MFVIPCKYTKEKPYIITLVEQIREYHSQEKIVVVDSDSEDKSYFKEIEKYNVIIEDIANRNYCIGAYWYCYKKYPNEDFYYFLHDSCIVRANLDFLKEKDLTVLAHFNWVRGHGDIAENEIIKYTKYKIPNSGDAIYATIFFCKKIVMDKLFNANVDKILPNCSEHSGPIKNEKPVYIYALEGAYGLMLEQEGYKIKENSLAGYCQGKMKMSDTLPIIKFNTFRS